MTPADGSPRKSVRNCALTALLIVVGVPVTACESGRSGEVEIEGRWQGPETVTLDVLADGTALGHDGCNRVTVEWAPSSGGEGSFIVTGSTEALCPDIDGWVDARAYSVVEGDLVIESSRGEHLTTLHSE